MKAILEFDLTEEKEVYTHAINGADYYNKLEEIWYRCFRPYYKHGYGEEIDKISENLPRDENEEDIIDKLASIYTSIVNE